MFLKREEQTFKTKHVLLCVYFCVCVCAYLQVVVVSPAAAVEVLGGALVQVENRAEITEVP